jgi:hypothetical protein
LAQKHKKLQIYRHAEMWENFKKHRKKVGWNMVNMGWKDPQQWMKKDELIVIFYTDFTVP